MTFLGIMPTSDAELPDYVVSLTSPTTLGEESFYGGSISFNDGKAIVTKPRVGFFNYVSDVFVFDGTSGTFISKLSDITNDDLSSMDFTVLDNYAIADNGVNSTLYDVVSGNLIQTFNDTSSCKAISGNNFLIGESVYDISTGNLIVTIANPIENGSNFGNQCAINGNDIILYNSFYENQQWNRIYQLFDESGNLIQTFDDPDSTTGDMDGKIAISGNKLIVIKPNIEAIVFDMSTGNHLKTLKNPTFIGQDNFGTAITVDGNKILIGAQSAEDEFGINSGVVYVFDINSGNLLQIISNPVSSDSDYFGRRIAMEDNNVIITATDAKTNDVKTGAVYLFNLNTIPPSDVIAPVVTTPQTIRISSNNSSEIITWENATATDNYGIPSIPVCDFSSGSNFQIGTTIVTCTSTDDTGNIGTDSFSVIIDDIGNPEIEILNIQPSNADNELGSRIQYIIPTVTDNSGESIIANCSPESNSIFPIGETIVTCTASDSSGNSNSTEFIITILEEPTVETTTEPTVETSQIISKEPLSFVDKSKDPKTYVERYVTEPSYKEWFDSNYPDYTIYEGIGITEDEYLVIVASLEQSVTESSETTEIEEPIVMDNVDLPVVTTPQEKTEEIETETIIQDDESSCGTGTKDVNGICVLIESQLKSEPSCGIGTIEKNGICVVDTSKSNEEKTQCGEGTYVENGICVVDKNQNTQDSSVPKNDFFDSLIKMFSSWFG